MSDTIVNVIIYKHDRNGVIIGDFQDPRYNCAVSAIAVADCIIITSRRSKECTSIYHLGHYDPDVCDVIYAIARYTKCDTQTEDNGKILMYKHDVLSGNVCDDDVSHSKWGI